MIVIVLLVRDKPKRIVNDRLSSPCASHILSKRSESFCLYFSIVLIITSLISLLLRIWKAFLWVLCTWEQQIQTVVEVGSTSEIQVLRLHVQVLMHTVHRVQENIFHLNIWYTIYFHYPSFFWNKGKISSDFAWIYFSFNIIPHTWVLWLL